MNLSQITVDLLQEPKEDLLTPKLRSEESRLIGLVEAIETVRQSREWSSLKTEVFEPLVFSLEKELKSEGRKDDPSPTKLNRLAGELKWAEKYADLDKLANAYRIELQRVRIQLHGNTE